MRSIVLSLMLVWTVLCLAEVQSQDKGHALKLCGREFLRAVVYTCGGSRWRRLAKEESLSQDSREPAHFRTRDVASHGHWRDTNKALVALCCQHGCRKSDLSLMC